MLAVTGGDAVLLDAQPRCSIATLPTPLVDATRLRVALGGVELCPRILIKRDDLTGLALGGGKARKLEFLVADALRQKATVLVVSGPIQSNCAAMTAAVAPLFGLTAALVLSSRGSAPIAEGNILLAHMFGATVFLASASNDLSLAVPEDDAENVARVVGALRRAGERPYVIPPGGSSAVGALGYVDATRELLNQLASRNLRADRLYYASGSRGIQAGLELGSRLFSAPYKLCGIAVSGGESSKQLRAVALITGAARLLGSPVDVLPSELVTSQEHLGSAYGVSTDGSREAAHLLARHEGILLDPAYTAKAMAALIADIRRRDIDASETVVFLHTGGTAALFTDTYRLELDSTQPLQFSEVPS